MRGCALLLVQREFLLPFTNRTGAGAKTRQKDELSIHKSTNCRRDEHVKFQFLEVLTRRLGQSYLIVSPGMLQNRDTGLGQRRFAR